MVRKVGLCVMMALAVALMPPSSRAGETCAADLEYAVYAAILFSGPSDSPPPAPDSKKGPDRSLFPRAGVDLQGIVPGPYTILLRTKTAAETLTEAGDGGMVGDFNRKNLGACDLDAARFLSRLAPDQRPQVAFLSEEERKSSFQAGGWAAFRRDHTTSSGLTSLSRVGFNADRTLAMVDIQNVSDYEMGIGYRVTLERAPGREAWVVVEARVNRRF